MADDFLAKQLPHNVTWGLTMLYSLEHPGNFDDNKYQEALQFLSSSPIHESIGTQLASAHIASDLSLAIN